MTEENKGTMLTILAIVAIVAIVGLILLFNGSITGKAINEPKGNPGTCVIIPNTNAPDTVTLGEGLASANGVCDAATNGCAYCIGYCSVFPKINDKYGCGGGSPGGGKTCPVDDGTCSGNIKIGCVSPTVWNCQNGVESCVTCDTTGGGGQTECQQIGGTCSNILCSGVSQDCTTVNCGCDVGYSCITPDGICHDKSQTVTNI